MLEGNREREGVRRGQRREGGEKRVRYEKRIQEGNHGAARVIARSLTDG